MNNDLEFYEIDYEEMMDMDIEDIEEIEEETEEIDETPEKKFLEGIGRQRSRRIRSHRNAVNRFLGKGKKENATVIKPTYYGELLTWALHHYMETEGWKVVKTMNYELPEPKYIDVETSPDEKQNLLKNGTLFLIKGNNRLTVTVDIDFNDNHELVITGLSSKENIAQQFATGVDAVAMEKNFYRGQKIELRSHIRFLRLSGRTWESVALSKAIKDEIKANTAGFLNHSKALAGYGIPARRGILLTGEPGTGKTLVCKTLMADCPGITCIVANTHFIENGLYIRDLYDLAQDLAPCIVFIEDIDLIGRKRMASGYASGAALLSLLNIIDGIEEQKEIVTVATTNYLEALDQAIIQRPSRFDRIIELHHPALQERKKLISALCQKIPLLQDVQEYIARRTENHTPAQVQEIIYSLAINYLQNNGGKKEDVMRFSHEEIDEIIRKIGKNNGQRLGFCAVGREISSRSSQGA